MNDDDNRHDSQEGASEGFGGVIGRTFRDSTPWWPPIDNDAAGKPNVVMIVLDDVGFGSLGCYGAEIDTRHIDRLAERGLRYNHFNVSPLCSSTRAALLTGRNHHSVGMAYLANVDSGYPGYRGRVAKEAGTLAEVLRDGGYATMAVGKWHLAPIEQTTAVGPYDQWPLARGFNRYYGFLDALADQFYPDLVHDNHRVDPPATPEEGYHLSEDLIDRSIGFVDDHVSLAPEQPFHLYLAFGAAHCPHQAPESYLEKYRGRYDEGWDRIREARFARQRAIGVIPEDASLPAANPGVEAWDDLDPDQRRLYARMQEAYAAFIDHTDDQIGRLLDHLEAIGKLDDTIVVLLSDNGASQEGGPHGGCDITTYEEGEFCSVEFNLERIDTIGGPESQGASTPSAGPSRRSTCPGGGRRRPTPRCATTSRTPTPAGCAPPSSSRGPGGSRIGVRCGGSSITPSTWSPRCSTWSGSHRRPRSAGWRRCRTTASACATASRTATPPVSAPPSTSR
jgi:arylsulfatase